MALAYRSSATTAADWTAGITISKPTGTADGDLLWAIICHDSTAATTGPSGWTEERSMNDPVNSAYRSTWSKRAGASEPSTYDWSWTGVQYSFGGISAYSGGVAAGADTDISGAANNGNDATAIALSATTTVADTMIVVGGATYNAGSFGLFTGSMNERFDLAGNAVNADILQAAVGASGNKSSTLSGGDQWVAHLLAFKPAAGAAAASLIHKKSFFPQALLVR